MATPFNQGAPTVPVVLNTSNVFVFGNTASGNALSVQQLGTGNVATFRTTTGATALFVNAAGNVGIGTANPSYQFSVATGLGATATPTVQIADTVGPKSLSVIPNASSGMYNAMVATGDTLVVAGAGTTVNTGVLTLAPWSGSSVGARIGGSSNIFGIYSNATTFYSNAVSPATVMTVTNGRVGIGTTSPLEKLDIRGGSISMGEYFTSTGSRYVGFGYNDGSSYRCIAGMEIENTTLGGNYSQKVHFRSHSYGSSEGRRMTIAEGGNVGIGTTSPGYPLEVSGAAYMSGTVYVGTTNTDPTLGRLNGINLRSDGRFFSRSSGHSLGIDSTSGTQIQFWTDNGSNRVATGAITSSGSTTSYTSASDYRLKENVQPITMAMDVIARLRPVTYTWKSDGSPGHGFIAHELQEVVPDAVVGEKDAVDSDGNIKPQGIDKSYLVSYLTAAIQELSTKNAALEARLAALEGIVGSLVPPAPPS